MIEDGVRLIGNVVLGQRVSICAPSEIMAKHSQVLIGEECDIAAFVTITTADSHRRCLGLTSTVDRKEIVIEDHVFIGQGAIILGGTRIGHHSVIGAGVILSGHVVPPYSRVTTPPPVIMPQFYAKKFDKGDDQ